MRPVSETNVPYTCERGLNPRGRSNLSFFIGMVDNGI